MDGKSVKYCFICLTFTCHPERCPKCKIATAIESKDILK